ncbi:hypothetical protein CDL12_27070 [Handroanthus impetiginosus]|uniref:Pectinesterase inhibitor domain-containing protein n=1 Tax=Handroanthus impetiginosus TaxID=429701 RepID=A0A2G9G5E9_9LAMI|nr:hypothetical protein CDL12_27070 [Handroanthus impetiginosus]
MKVSFTPTYKPTFVLISFLTSLLISSTAISPNDLINNVCQKTNNPLCTKILKSNRRARKALSVRVRGEIALDMAISCTDSTDKLLQSLQRITRNRQLRQKYKNCWVYYALIYNYLDQAKHDFRCNDFGGVRKNIGAVLKEYMIVKSSFKDSWLRSRSLNKEMKS